MQGDINTKMFLTMRLPATATLPVQGLCAAVGKFPPRDRGAKCSLTRVVHGWDALSQSKIKSNDGANTLSHQYNGGQRQGVGNFGIHLHES